MAYLMFPSRKLRVLALAAVLTALTLLSPATLRADGDEGPGAGTETPITEPAPAEPEESPALPAVRDYLRFQVHQQLVQPFAGTLRVILNEETHSVDVAGQARLDTYLMVAEPELGDYRLELLPIGHDSPALFIEGELRRVGVGEYEHRLLRAGADPTRFALPPEEVGVVLAIGAIDGFLRSCVSFVNPFDGTLTLAVDTDASGNLDDAERVEMPLVGQQSACGETPGGPLPLTSLYEARVTAADGSLVALNTGAYDFLFKAGIDSRKEANQELLRSFSVEYIRTPIATSVSILNSSIRPPEVRVRVEPRAEETTMETIRFGEELVPTPVVLVATPTPAAALDDPAGGSSAQQQRSGLLDYWPVLAVLLGVIIGAVLLAAHKNRPVQSRAMRQ